MRGKEYASGWLVVLSLMFLRKCTIIYTYFCNFLWLQRGKQRVWEDDGRGKDELEGLKGVEMGGILRGLCWVERQLSSTHNLNLLHAYTSGRHHVKEGRCMHIIQPDLKTVFTRCMTNIHTCFNDNTEQGTHKKEKNILTPSWIALIVL